jgi:hypothetical protein
MCYSGRCRWEDDMGNCSYPMYIKELWYKYDWVKMCLSGVDNIDLYNDIQSEIKTIKIIKERKEKIVSLKSKLLTQNI